MASKSKIKLESRFPAVKKAGRAVTLAAVQHALEEGEQTANLRIEKGDGARGYNLPADVHKETSGMDGKIIYDHFFGRFFEYGTVFISAMPFMRPAHRRMRKVFREFMGTQFEGWVRRRTHFR